MFIDTHTHLTFEDFDQDRDQVIRRAGAAGVERIITLGTDLPVSKAAVAIAAQYSSLFAAVGIHPSEAHHASPEDYPEIKRLAEGESKVVAIGETGLDFYWSKQHWKEQYDNFRQMLRLAREVDLPVVIHNRAAQREMQWFFQEEGIEQLNGVMHCFAGGIIDARFYLDMGLHISFTANITHQDFPHTDVVKYVPLERVMIETDSPYIPPAPFRKQRNEPAYVTYVAERLATIHGKSLEEIAQQTSENAKQLFRLP